MGIRPSVSTVNIFQTVLSTQFTSKVFIVVNSSIKTYNLGSFSVVSSDVVLINGLFQQEGANNSYQLVGTDIIFAETKILTINDNITVYFDGQI